MHATSLSTTAFHSRGGHTSIRSSLTSRCVTFFLEFPTSHRIKIPYLCLNSARTFSKMRHPRLEPPAPGPCTRERSQAIRFAFPIPRVYNQANWRVLRAPRRHSPPPETGIIHGYPS